jgi:lysophospholipase L1-like esterase
MYRIVLAMFRGLIEKTKQMRLSQLEEFNVPPGKVLFLGDSITEGGVWSEWFPELDTVNRGVGSDTISGVMGRLDRAINQPALISLLIGTNDLSGLGTSTKVPDIAAQMKKLVEQIRELAPDAPLIINSVMPRHRSYAQRVQELNAHYRQIAADNGATFLDLWPSMAGPKNGMKPEFTRDELHLNGPGYRSWVDLLRPAIAEITTPAAQ